MRPDLLMIATLHYKGIIDHDEADALVKLYGEAPTFDRPVPINLPTAIDRVVEALIDVEDDDVVESMIAGKIKASANEHVCDESCEVSTPTGPPPFWVLDAFQWWNMINSDD